MPATGALAPGAVRRARAPLACTACTTCRSMDENGLDGDPVSGREVNRIATDALTERAKRIAVDPPDRSGAALDDPAPTDTRDALPLGAVDRGEEHSSVSATIARASADRLALRERTAGADSLDAFLASVEKRAFVIARLSTRDDDAALDIVQDAMLRMFERYADKPDAERAALFFRILNNRVTDHHRRRGFDRLVRWFGERGERPTDARETVDAVDQLVDDAAGPARRADADALGVELRRALDRLPHRQRQVFVLRHWQGMDVAETAFALQISEGSVKTHLSRAMRALRTSLRELEA